MDDGGGTKMCQIWSLAVYEPKQLETTVETQTLSCKSINTLFSTILSQTFACYEKLGEHQPAVNIACRYR